MILFLLSLKKIINMQFNCKNLIFIAFIGFFSFQSVGQKDKKINESKTPTGGTVTTYKNGDLVYDIVDEPAQFPGGIQALKNYLAENITYPQIAVDKGLQGKCYIQFVVSETGTIEHVEVKKGVRKCKVCDQEAVRVIKSMPKWEPGTINGKPVNSTFSVPVSFKL